jgi:hypothetical protein
LETKENINAHVGEEKMKQKLKNCILKEKMETL